LALKNVLSLICPKTTFHAEKETALPTKNVVCSEPLTTNGFVKYENCPTSVVDAFGKSYDPEITSPDTFSALTPWPGDLVCAQGRYPEGETEKRAAIFIGPEFGTVQRVDLAGVFTK
jgi:hypothetical protein